jgi:protein phosphatase 2C-like protein
LSDTRPVPDRLGDGEVPGWRVLTTVARGAIHELAGRPLEDAAGFGAHPADVPRWLTVAVADGHGGRPHFRSGRGAELAVAVGLQLAGEMAARFAAGESAAELRLAARTELVPEVIGRWRRAVERDLAQRPWSSQEQQLLASSDVTVPYGSTLLLAVMATPWLVLCQIGDGDVLMVGSDGLASLPIPGDARLDGNTTTSLCQPDAADSFRLAVVDLAGSQVAALLLATDGFGNAQAAEPWYQPVGGDLVRMARQHGVAWVREQLPLWAARCASSDGSGDDTAVALLLRTDASGALATPVRTQTHAKTLPIDLRPDHTLPLQVQHEQPQPQPQPQQAQRNQTRPAETLPWTRSADPPAGEAPAGPQAQAAPPWTPGAPV